MARSWILLVVVLVGGTAAESAGADDLIQQYVKGLRQQGFPDLAIDYLNLELAKPGLSVERQAELEYEIAVSLIDFSDLVGDLSKKETKLEEARAKFAEFAKKYPNLKDPVRRADALVNVATIDLRQGRLKVVEAQLPSNASQAVALADRGRSLFTKAADGYENAYKILLEEYERMPKYIPVDTREDRAKRQYKSELFDKYIEAEFQSSLARFYLADSYVSIEIPEPSDPKDAKAVEQHAKEKAKWQKRFQETIAVAREGFNKIYTGHRRELVGQYGDLWRARCMAAQGDHRRAMAIFEQLMEHEDPELDPFKREVFLFSMLSLEARGEFDQIRNRAEPWLRTNFRHRRSSTARGVIMSLARAYIALGKASKNDNDREKYFHDADNLLDELASTQNEFSGLARREQLKLSTLMKRTTTARTFPQLFSLANAKLDLLKPETPADERKAILRETKQLFNEALDQANDQADPELVNSARLALAYTYLLDNDYYQAAILSEFVAQNFPKSKAAPQAAYFAVTAYAWGYESALQRQSQDSAAFPDVDVERMRSLSAYLFDRWPDSKEASDARMTMGRLEFSLRRFEEAADAFDNVGQRSPEFPSSRHMAGRVYWDWYKFATQDDNQGIAAEQLKTLRANSLGRFTSASNLLRAMSGGKINETVFDNDSLLAEVHYDAGDDKSALAKLQPLISAIEQNALPGSVDSKRRIDALVTALQCHIRQNQIKESEALVDLVGKQQGAGASANVTRVFVDLATRIKDQINRLEASGDAAKLKETTDTFESFLLSISERDEGQDIDSWIYLGSSFLELGNHRKAIELLEKALADPGAGAQEKAQLILQARVLQVRAYRLAGDLKRARGLMDPLYMGDNRRVVEVILERGEVLDAQGDDSGDYTDSIGHYKDVVSRMMRSRPRPETFYVAMERLLKVYKKVPSSERKKRLAEGRKYAAFLAEVDHHVPPKWKTVFRKYSNEFSAALGIK